MKKVALAMTAVLGLVGTTSFAGTPTIDGVLDAAAGYTALGMTQAPGDNTTFGSGIDASALYFTEDGSNIYLFVQSKGNTTNNDGVMVLLGTSGQAGLAANTAGVGGATGGHALDGNSGSDIGYTFEFEVDYAWAANTGSSATNWFIDTAELIGARSTGFTGNSLQAGAPLLGTYGETHAFNNAGLGGGLGSSTGWEISFPRSALGGIGVSATIQAFATVVNSNGFFSGDCAPDAVAANPGSNVTWNTQTGTQVGTASGSVPVEVSDFVID